MTEGSIPKLRTTPGPELRSEETACIHCGRIMEIEALADSCDRDGCPLNALFERVPLVTDREWKPIGPSPDNRPIPRPGGGLPL